MPKKDKGPSEDDLYHVEVITKARVTPVSDDDEEAEDDARSKKKHKKKNKHKIAARWEYYVKWAGYESDSNSWEPEENVAGCQRLLASFWEHVGTDDDDYPVGYVVKAKEDWIKRERAHFKAEFDDAQRKLRVEREKADLERVKKMKKKLKKTSRAASPVADDKLLRSFTKRKRQEGDSDDDASSTTRKLMKSGALSGVPTGDERTQQLEQVDSWAESLFSEPPSPEQPTPTSQPMQTSAKPLPQPKVQLPRRPSNPHAKIVGVLPQPIAPGSGISTKQRLGQGALAPTRPNAIPLSVPRERPPAPPPVRTNSGSLIPLSFKKKLVLPPTAGSSSRGLFSKDALRTSTSPQIPLEQRPDTNAPTPSVNRFTQPSQGVVPSHIDSIMHEEPMSMGLPVITQSPIDIPYLGQAESFLQSIMPPALAAPLTPTVASPREPVPPHPLTTKQAISSQRIPKKWSWSGGAYIEASANLSAPLCHVTFCDTTDPLPDGVRFSVALDASDRVEFSTFHNIVDLPVILQACGHPQQFARVVPKENKDIENLQVFRTYMVKHQKVVLVPVSLDEKVIGHIFIFPESRALCDRFKVPLDVYAPKSQMLTYLVAALLPWSLSPTQIAKRSRLPPSIYLPTNTDIESTLDKTRWERSIRLKPVYHHALRILHFPAVLHKFMSEPNHSFDVWWEGGDGSKRRAGIETHMLFSIMEQCRAKKINYEPRGADPRLASDPRVSNDSRVNTEPRVIFVHVGAVKTLRQLPGLLDLCSKSLTQFWTYGTHRTVSPDYWGVREIYPCGGIITFTPEAVLDNYIDVLEKIRQIQRHPLWVCYILPSVLGMVAKGDGDDPVTVFDSGRFPFLGLFTAISDGHVALLTAPPVGQPPMGRNNSREAWIRNHWTHRPQDARSTLQFCTSAFNSKYANMQKKEVTSAIKTEISNDLSCMRQQATLMSEYRRYVVLGTERDGRIRKDDGLEWVTAKKFDFKDNYFME